MAATTNFTELFKAQMLLNQKDNVILGFILLTVFEFVTGFLRELFQMGKTHLDTYLRSKFKTAVVATTNIVGTPKYSELHFKRHYNRDDTWNRADAILSHVLKIPATQSILVVGQLELVRNMEEFKITDKISFQLENLHVGENGGLEQIEFKIFSTELTVCELRSFIDNLVEDYLIVKKNKLGNKTFYFDQIVEKKGGRVPVTQKLVFSLHEFCTNRTLDNVFHERQTELQNRVNFFLNRKDWYDERGIPHTFGLLLHGCPGTGKTSTIKAIANVSKRHIVNINLSTIKTKKQLKKLFYDNRLEVCENTENTHATTEYIIPIDKRVYVIEDIDAIEGDLVAKRTVPPSDDDSAITFIPDTPAPASRGMMFSNELEDDKDDLDLSTLLNIIDGTLETPGRILIISSNYPERLDEALIRPGRIDMLIEYKKCNRKVLADMFQSFFQDTADRGIGIGQLEQIPEYKWSPAEVGQILFKNFGNPAQALKELTELDPSEYFKFSYAITESPPQVSEKVVLEKSAQEQTLAKTVSNRDAEMVARGNAQAETVPDRNAEFQKLMAAEMAARGNALMDIMSEDEARALLGGDTLEKRLQNSENVPAHSFDGYKSHDCNYMVFGEM